MRLTYLLASVSSLLLVGAPPASGESLQDALGAAYLNNPDIRVQRDAADIAEERINQARSRGKPTVSVFGSYLYESIDSSRPFAFNNGDRPVASAQLEARFPIYSGGRLGAGVRQAEANAFAADAQLDAATQSLMLDTITSYVDIIRDRAVIDIRNSSIELLEGQLTASEDRFEVGDITRTDVALSEARLEGGRAQLAAAEAQLEGSLAYYVYLTGTEAGELAPVPPAPELPATFEQALDQALNSNPAIEAARHAEQAAREAIKFAKGSLRPELAAIAQAGVQEYHTDGFTDTNFVAGAQASVPLFTGGLNASRLREAKLQRSQALSQIALNERLIRAQVAQAWYAHEAASRAVAATERQVEAAEIAYEGAQEELKVGFRTTLDVLDQEQQLLEARLAVVTAKRDRYVAVHQLLAAMGRLSPEMLGIGIR
ncbi:TolC family outer membrane protein [Henriciella sp. AS95]|uniref:TolC family outer membrane protein n=1 Tax=Henriciella sp. AS95 TaxID=3135782 RepID=UPI00317526E2